MGEESTTATYINGDKPDEVGTMDKVKLYFRLNEKANNEPAVPFPIKNFSLNEKKLNHSFNRLGITPSPSRAMSDLFWINVNWQEIKKTLGEINILDFGCGNGGYFKKLYEWSNKSISSNL